MVSISPSSTWSWLGPPQWVERSPCQGRSPTSQRWVAGRGRWSDYGPAHKMFTMMWCRPKDKHTKHTNSDKLPVQTYMHINYMVVDTGLILLQHFEENVDVFTGCEELQVGLLDLQQEDNDPNPSLSWTTPSHQPDQKCQLPSERHNLLQVPSLLQGLWRVCHWCWAENWWWGLLVCSPSLAHPSEGWSLGPEAHHSTANTSPSTRRGNLE